ncbi:ABC transporter ATP-binding protein [Bosea sp. MMO-172]|uniref:ABC transporter ATP-binding protein n=1 Tax=Bosea sp. MMO-172 TaxID=3127885 RepID=UPI0030161493
MAIVAQGLSVTLGGRIALDRVDARLEPGQVLGIIGPNGAGKTTLLRVLAGLLKPDAGSVRYDGAGPRELGRRALARRVAFLAQDSTAVWSLSVDAVVGLGRLPHRQAFSGENEADRAAIVRAMAHCDVASFTGRTIGALSGGERRRVLLARALAVEADYLLADEPLAGLDPGHQLETLQLLRSIAAAGTGVAVVLHDLSLAARFCDRLLLLHQGRGVADGAPDAVLDDTSLAEVFGVTALRGSHAGEPFLLSWQTTTRGPNDDRR